MLIDSLYLFHGQKKEGVGMGKTPGTKETPKTECKFRITEPQPTHIFMWRIIAIMNIALNSNDERPDKSCLSKMGQ